MIISSSEWLVPCFRPKLRNQTVDKICNELKENRWQPIDFIAVRGTSGLCIGMSVAEKLQIPFALVRKPKDRSHGRDIEGIALSVKNKRYVIIDDCIDSGETVEYIANSLHKLRHKCVGLILYNQDLSYLCGKNVNFKEKPFGSVSGMWSTLDWIPQLYYFWSK